MVGRASPKYKGYSPKDDDDETVAWEPVDLGDDKDVEEERGTAFVVDKPDDPDEAIAEERQVLERGRAVRAIDKEAKELRQPRITCAKDRLGKAGSRLASFGAGIAQEGIRATRSRKSKRGKSGVRVRESMGYRGVFHPESSDISLSKAIAMNNWSGAGSGLMERDFFGHGSEDRELIRDRNDDINIGENFQDKFFGSKKNQDLLGDRDKSVNIGSNVETDFFGGNNQIDFIGGNKKNKKKKEIKYF